MDFLSVLRNGDRNLVLENKAIIRLTKVFNIMHSDLIITCTFTAIKCNNKLFHCVSQIVKSRTRYENICRYIYFCVNIKMSVINLCIFFPFIMT